MPDESKSLARGRDRGVERRPRRRLLRPARRGARPDARVSPSTRRGPSCPRPPGKLCCTGMTSQCTSSTRPGTAGGAPTTPASRVRFRTSSASMPKARTRQTFGGFMREVPCPACQRGAAEAHRRARGDGWTAGPSRTSARCRSATWPRACARWSCPRHDSTIAGPMLAEIASRLQLPAGYGPGLPVAGPGRRRPWPAARRSGSGWPPRSARGLAGVLYVLDEPSIGLHQRDNHRLLETLTRLRDLGNTLIVVEHDEDTIRAADWIVEHRPAGRRAWWPHRGLRPARGPAGQPRVADRRVPERPEVHRRAGGAPEAVPRAGRSWWRARARTTCGTWTSRSRSGCSSRSRACPAPGSPPWSTRSSTAPWRGSCTAPDVPESTPASREWSTWTRSCAWTRAPSARPQGLTPRPTPGSSMISASCSRDPGGQGSRYQPGGSPSTSKAAGAKRVRATARSRSRCSSCRTSTFRARSARGKVQHRHCRFTTRARRSPKSWTCRSEAGVLRASARIDRI